MVIEKVIKYVGAAVPSYSGSDSGDGRKMPISLPRVRFLERDENSLSPANENIEPKITGNAALKGKKLSPREEQVYKLWKEQQMTNTQIADALRLSKDAARSMLSRARYKLGDA
jgi:DNA-binding NarL/FixJ family response regulator